MLTQLRAPCFGLRPELGLPAHKPPLRPQAELGKAQQELADAQKELASQADMLEDALQVRGAGVGVWGGGACVRAHVCGYVRGCSCVGVGACAREASP